MLREDLVEKLRSHLSLEEDLGHRMFLDSLYDLNRTDAREALEVMHLSYLIRGRLLEKIAIYSITHDLPLPSFGELIDYEN